MKKKFFDVSYTYKFGKAKSISVRSIPGKYQFGDLVHAKRAAENYIGEKLTWRKDTQVSYNLWNGYDNSDNWLADIREFKKRSGNPKRKKIMRKKKRSAKQLANDKRLGRMAKARAKAKRGGRRKVTRKKVARKKTRRKVVRRRANPKRKVSAKSHLWTVFRCRGKSVYYLALKGFKLGWTLTRGHAISFKSKSEAAKTARKMSQKRGWSAWQFGVANELQSTAQIGAACKAGK